MLKVICLFAICWAFSNACEPSITTASGWAAEKTICKGQPVFEEHFDTLDKKKWEPIVSLFGSSEGEFQWYVADSNNSFARDGQLHITPTLTADKIGYDNVENGHIIVDGCTDQNQTHCERQAGGDIIINPIMSARLHTTKSFSFKYGHVEVVAKTPLGDWLWPAIWLMPTKNAYGGWPRSGEIDLLESRGNIKYGNNNSEIGVEKVLSTLHFGPARDQRSNAGYSKQNSSGFHSGLHKYELIWDLSGIKYFVDGTEIGYASVQNETFWERGGFHGDNIWASGTRMAPFDEEFHFIINIAVGGVSGYFPDVNNQNGKKPWANSSKKAMKEFWTHREQWLPSWKDSEASSMIIDSIKVTAV